jgi:hypothetical protein
MRSVSFADADGVDLASLDEPRDVDVRDVGELGRLTHA